MAPRSQEPGSDGPQGDAAGRADGGTGREDAEQAAPSGMSAFAAAIERKKAAGQARSAHLDGSSAVGGATANRKTSRTFRRKSG
jgi:hypothetical protein